MADEFGGEEAFAYFFTTGIPRTVELLVRLQGMLHQRGEVAMRDETAKILTGLLEEVNFTAVRAANFASGAIIVKMLQTHGRNRPYGGEMQTHILSEPGALGLVRVALIKELDKIVNPRGGWGPFWRAQEFGTGSDEVKSQVGREIFGTFYESETPPDPAQRGLGEGHDLAFIPMGSAPGLGRITVELPGRHFLRDGSAEAGAMYRERMSEIQQRYLDRVKALTAQIEARARGRGRGLTWLIEA